MGLLFRRRRPVLTHAVGAPTSAVPSASATAEDAGPDYTGPDPVAELQRITALHDAGEMSDLDFARAKRDLMGI
jgi:hypothetical protein